MRLDLRFTNRPLEDLWCQAVVMLSFRIQDKMPNALNAIDKKMTESISNIIQSGLWSGVCGDKLLFATQNSIKADKLLIHGLGEETMYSLDLLKREIQDVGNTLDKMCINEFCFYLPEVPGPESEYIIHLETATKCIAGIFLDKYKDEAGYILKMYISIDNKYTGSVEKITNNLRHYFSPFSDLTIILDKATGYPGTGMSELAA